MKISFLSIITFLISHLALSQVTFHLTSIPSSTPTGATIYIAGSMNSWDPGNASWSFTQVGAQGYFLTANIPTGAIQYKFTRGAWASVEGNASGGFLTDRSSNVNPGDTLELSILSWEDLGGTSGTALSTVSIMSSTFFMPQLNRSRRIWICLPTNYQTATNTNYRVVYMQDGQNLFDDALSFAGEWGIDESMRDLMLMGDPGAIIVGIDNSAERLDEYSPWVNPNYGGGEGEAYIDFIKNTLKPYVDANYRTLTNASNTAIAGSSMGGLISLYAAVKYPETFGKAGIFSPAYWFARDSLFSWVSTQSIPSDLKIYTVAGTNESSSMINDINALRTNLQEAGLPNNNMLVLSQPDGAHSEWFWKREFPAAYQWLFQSGTTAIQTSNTPELILNSYPNPAITVVSIDFSGMKNVQFEVFNSQGLKVFQDSLQFGNKYQLSTIKYGSGTYFLRGADGNGQAFSCKIVVAKP
jgi:predicted alpha/beta superfamily hydrolase